MSDVKMAAVVIYRYYRRHVTDEKGEIITLSQEELDNWVDIVGAKHRTIPALVKKFNELQGPDNAQWIYEAISDSAAPAPIP